MFENTEKLKNDVVNLINTLSISGFEVSKRSQVDKNSVYRLLKGGGITYEYGKRLRLMVDLCVVRSPSKMPQMYFTKQFGRKVFGYKKQTGLTYKQIGDKIGVGQLVIFRLAHSQGVKYENGYRVEQFFEELNG